MIHEKLKIQLWPRIYMVCLVICFTWVTQTRWLARHASCKQVSRNDVTNHIALRRYSFVLSIICVHIKHVIRVHSYLLLHRRFNFTTLFAARQFVLQSKRENVNVWVDNSYISNVVKAYIITEYQGSISSKNRLSVCRLTDYVITACNRLTIFVSKKTVSARLQLWFKLFFIYLHKKRTTTK